MQRDSQGYSPNQQNRRGSPPPRQNRGGKSSAKYQEPENDTIFDLYNDVIHPRRMENPPITRLLYSILVKDKKAEEELENVILKTIDDANLARSNENSEGGIAPTFSGFLLLQGNFGLHFLENEGPEIEKFIKDMRNEVNKEDSIYKKITILCVNEENAERMMIEWKSLRVYGTGDVISEVDKSNEFCKNRIWEIYKMFLDASHDLNIAENGFSDNVTAKEFGRQIALTSDDPYILVHGPFPDINKYYELVYEDDELVLDDEVSFPQPCYFVEYLEYLDEQFSTYNNFRS